MVGSCMAGGVCGRGGGMHGGECAWQGVCMVGGMCGRGHVWQEGHAWQGHAWWGLMCGRGPCVAGETATAAYGTYPTGMHSC